MNKKNTSEQPDKKYFLVRPIRFTLLEEYIYRVIKESTNSVCNDAHITDVLCLDTEEVRYVIENGTLGKFRIIQGDYSRRTIRANFAKNQYLEGPPPALLKNVEWSILSPEHQDAIKDKSKYRKLEESQWPKGFQKLQISECYLIIGEE